MRKTLTSAACLLLVAATVTMSGAALNDAIALNVNPEPVAPLGNDAGCRTGSNGWGYALAGTPDGPCDWTPDGLEQEFSVAYVVVDCPAGAPWNCYVDLYTHAPDWSSYEGFYFYCPPGTTAIYDFATLPPTAVPILSTGSCEYYEWGWPNSNADPSNWDFFLGYGSGVDLTFSITDNLVDAALIHLGL
jgi:hypothetical protein